MPQSFADALSWVPKSRDLAATLVRACEYARAQAHKTVALEHVLLALAEDADAAPVLHASSVDLGRLAADLSVYLARLENQASHDEPGEPVAAPDLIRILDYAAAAARQSRRREVNGAIVLAAIVGEGKSAAAEMLRSQGMTFEAAIRALQRANAPLQAPAAPPVAERPAAPDQSAPELDARDPVAQPAPRVPRPTASPVPLEEKPHINGVAAPTTDELLATVRRHINSGKVVLPEMPAHSPGTLPQADGARPPPAPSADPAPQPDGTPHVPPDVSDARHPAPPRSIHDPPLSQLSRLTPPQAPRSEASSADHTGPERPPTAQRQWAPPPSQSASLRDRDHYQQPPREPPAPNAATQARRPDGGASGWSPERQARLERLRLEPRGGSAPRYPPGADQGADPARPLAGPPGLAGARGDHAFDGSGRGSYPPADAGRASHLPEEGSADAEAGQLVENIPRTMRVDVPELVEVRVARADFAALGASLQGRGAVHQHDLVVTKAMSVCLRAPEGGFWIETASPETQWIENKLGPVVDDYASWRWTVTPQYRGRNLLQLIVSTRSVGSDGLTAETALPDQVIEVSVATNYAREAHRWGGWIAAAVVGGILAKFGEGTLDAGLAIIRRIAGGS